MDQLSKIIGGGGMDDACSSNICGGGVTEANTKLCDLSATCTSGAATCVTNMATDGKDKDDSEKDTPTCAIAMCWMNA